MQLVEFNPDLSQSWDDFVSLCPMATFLHSRKFLAYHEDRFIDRSLLIYHENGKLTGLFPAALDPMDGKVVISHPGSTFGGILHAGGLLGETMITTLEAILQYYRAQGYDKLIYKAVPTIYHRTRMDDDLYALFRRNAHLYRRDLGCAIEIAADSLLSAKANSKMANMMRKATRHGLVVSDDVTYLPQLWHILETHLRDRYQTKPVHTLAEIQLLLQLFPDNIVMRVVLQANEVVSGTILFIDNYVMHTQYLVVSTAGKEFFALDFLIQACLQAAKQQALRYFDFGISTEQQGRLLNHSLYLSKAKHGGGGMVHDFYQLELAS